MKITSSILPFNTLCLFLISTWTTTSAAGTEFGYFWHLTDIHVDLHYNQKEECRAELLGNYKCDTPLPLLKSAMDLIERVSQAKAPDFLVFSGDSGPHIHHYTEEALETDMLTVSRELKRVFPPNNSTGVFILPSLGNHDLEPANRMSTKAYDPERTRWCTHLSSTAALWGSWINWNGATSVKHSPPTSSFSNGCYFSKLVQLVRDPQKRSVLLVSINGLLWYQANPDADPTDPDPLGQLAWLTASLNWARENKVKVVIASHFPPGASPNAPTQFRFLHPPAGDHFLQILRDNHDLLMSVLFAHIHTDSFRVLYDANGTTPLVPMFIGSSLNPITLRGLGGFNPRVRLYRYRQSDLQVMGYEQYYLDLSTQRQSTVWKLEYDSASAYGLADLSAASLSGLLDTFAEDNSPDGAWARYWSHELGLRPHEPKPGFLSQKGECPKAESLCRCQQLCAMRNLNLDSLDTCLLTCSGSALTFSLLLALVNTILARIVNCL